MKRSVVAASICLGALASSALAANVSIKGNLSQTVDGSDNYFMSAAPSGPTLRELSALNLDFLARMPTTSYDLKTNYSYYKYFGPGASDTALTSGSPAGATFSIDHSTDRLTKYNFATSWQRADITAAQLLQTGIVTATGSVNTYNVSGGVSRELSRTDSISLQNQASTVSYTAPGLTPYVDLSTTGTWSHLLGQTTSLINTVSVDYNSQDDPAKDQRLFWTVSTGLQSRLSSRLSVSGAIGMNFVNAWQRAGVASPALPPVPPGSPAVIPPPQLQPGAGHGWLGNVGLTYQLLKTTQVSLNASQSTTPTILGNLQQSSNFGFNLNHNINSLSNLSLSAQYAINTQSGNATNLLAGSATPASGGSTSDLFSASASYGYRLTRELRSSLSYTYTQVSGTTTSGLLKSNSVLVSLTRDFIVLP